MTPQPRTGRGSATSGYGIVIGLIVVAVTSMGSIPASARAPTEQVNPSTARHDPARHYEAAHLGVPEIRLSATSPTGAGLARSWPVLVAACVMLTIGCLAVGVAIARSKEASRFPLSTARRVGSGLESETRHRGVTRKLALVRPRGIGGQPTVTRRPAFVRPPTEGQPPVTGRRMVPPHGYRRMVVPHGVRYVMANEVDMPARDKATLVRAVLFRGDGSGSNHVGSPPTGKSVDAD